MFPAIFFFSPIRIYKDAIKTSCPYPQTHILHTHHAPRCLAAWRQIRNDRKRLGVPMCRSQLPASALPVRWLRPLSGAGRCRVLGARGARRRFEPGPAVGRSDQVAARLSDGPRYVYANMNKFIENTANQYVQRLYMLKVTWLRGGGDAMNIQMAYEG